MTLQMSDAFDGGWITCPAHVQIALISNKGHSAVISQRTDQPEFQPRHAPRLSVKDGTDLLSQQSAEHFPGSKRQYASACTFSPQYTDQFMPQAFYA